jgi:PAS domain S-box-containing protein
MADTPSAKLHTPAARSGVPTDAGSRPEEHLSGRIWSSLIIVSTVAVLLFSVYCLSHGITVVFMHLYYFPIVLLAYRYRYRGFALSSLLALAYVGLVYMYDIGQVQIIIEAWFRFIVFIGVAAVVAYLAERLAAAQHATREAAEVKEQYISLAPAIILALDAGGAITLLNDQGCIILGCRREEVIGKSWFDLFIPEKDRNRIREIFRRLMAGNVEPYRVIDNPVLTRNGTEKIIRWHNTVLHDERGSISGSLGLGEDVTEQIRAEEKIRRLQQFQESVIGNASVWITVLDTRGNILLWNEAAEAISGYPASEVLGGNTVWIRLFPDRDYREKVTAAIMRIIRQDQYLENFETEIRCRDGLKKIIVWNTRGLKNVEGDITRYLVIGKEITAQKLAEEEARRSSELYREFFITSMDCIFITSPDGQWIDFNESALELFGYDSREELVRVPIAQLYCNPEDRTAILDYIRREGYAREYPVQMRRRNGEIIETLITTMPLRNADGSVRVYVGTIHDITRRKQVEDALMMSEQKFRDIFNNTTDGILIHEIRDDGTPGKFTDANDVVCRMLGYTREEMLTKTPPDITTDYHNPPREETYETQRVTGGARFETEHRRKDGTILPVEVNTHVVTILGKKVILAVVRDITERKRAEEALQIAGKKISMLSSITRHDIRNQLMALGAYIALLKESVKDPELLTYIGKEDKIAEAIGRQIDFTKFYQDIGVNAPTWQEILELIQSAKTPLQELKGVEVTSTIPAVQIYADALIEKVFFNLMENSLRHGEHVTKISLSFRETDKGAIIMYEDNGVGISKEDKTHLFQKGFGKNTGLGMFLSKEILAITGITIRETGEPGKGVRFEITVPKGMYRFPAGNQEIA